MSRGASSDEVGVSGRGPGGVGENDDSDEGDDSEMSSSIDRIRFSLALGPTTPLVESITYSLKGWTHNII